MDFADDLMVHAERKLRDASKICMIHNKIKDVNAANTLAQSSYNHTQQKTKLAQNAQNGDNL